MKHLLKLATLLMLVSAARAQELTYDDVFVNSGQVKISWDAGTAGGAYYYEYQNSNTLITIYPFPQEFDQVRSGPCTWLTDYLPNGNILITLERQGFNASYFTLVPGPSSVLYDVMAAYRAAPLWIERGNVKFETRVLGNSGVEQLVIKFGATSVGRR